VREQKMDQLKQKKAEKEKKQQEKVKMRNEYKNNIQLRIDASDSGVMTRQNMMNQSLGKH